jgi:hypothetical protein
MWALGQKRTNRPGAKFSNVRCSPKADIDQHRSTDFHRAVILSSRRGCKRRATSVVSQAFVEDRIRDLIAKLIDVSLGYRFRS